MNTMYEIIVIQNDGELIDCLISVIKYLLNVYCKFMKTNLQVNLAYLYTNGAKLGVAAVARAPPPCFCQSRHPTFWLSNFHLWV